MSGIFEWHVRSALALLACLSVSWTMMGQPNESLAGPLTNTWKQKTDVASENPACASLISRMRKNAVSLAQLRLAIAKDAAGPAPSISGAVKNWLGEPYTSTSLQKKRGKFDTEMHETKELNTLARGLGCEPFDIDEEMRKELAKHPTPGGR